jgi:MFS family permease
MSEIVSPPAAAPVAAGAIRTAIGAISTTIACVVPVFLVGGLAVQIRDELRFSPAGLGLIVAVYFGVSALASLPSGRLVERYGPASTARAAILLAAGCLLAIAAAAHSFDALIGLLAASAGANALGQLASNVALAERIPPRRQGFSFGVKQSAIPIATLLAGAAVPAVALTLGWRWAFVAAAGLALTALTLVPPDGRTRRRRTARTDADQATAALVVVGLGATLAAGAANALGTFLVDASVARGVTPGLAGLTLTFGSAICVFSRVAAGWLADRREARAARPTDGQAAGDQADPATRNSRRGGGHVAVLAGLLVVGACGLAVLALPGPVALVTGVTLGFGLGWAWPGLMNFAVVQLNPTAPAAATSITQTGVYAGGCLGPLAFGPIATHAGYPQAWLSGAVAMLFSAMLMLLAREMLSRHAAALSIRAS